jgi:hypothetical protein
MLRMLSSQKKRKIVEKKNTRERFWNYENAVVIFHRSIFLWIFHPLEFSQEFSPEAVVVFVEIFYVKNIAIFKRERPSFIGFLCGQSTSDSTHSNRILLKHRKRKISQKTSKNTCNVFVTFTLTQIFIFYVWWKNYVVRKINTIFVPSIKVLIIKNKNVRIA